MIVLGSTPAVDEVRRALQGTASAGNARLEFHVRLVFWPRNPRGLRRGIVPALARTAGKAAKRFLASAGARFDGFDGEGVVDFGGWRCAVDFGAASLIVQQGLEWAGRPGCPISMLERRRARTLQPVWLFALLQGVDDARSGGSEEVGGADCQRFSLAVNVRRADASVPFDLSLPPDTHTVADLESVPLEVWIDNEQRIRRIRFASETTDMMLELSEFGAAPEPDWSRVPTYRTPSDAVHPKPRTDWS